MWKRAVTIDLQPWAFPERPRVLVELADQDRGLELAAAISRAGCTVGICRGPDAAADPATRCPLHRLEPCVAVEGADLVLTALDLEGEDGREVLRGLRTRYRSTPVVVEATVGQSLDLGDLLEGCTVVPVGAEPEQLVAAVLAALPSDSRHRSVRAERASRHTYFRAPAISGDADAVRGPPGEVQHLTEGGLQMRALLLFAGFGAGAVAVVTLAVAVASGSPAPSAPVTPQHVTLQIFCGDAMIGPELVVRPGLWGAQRRFMRRSCIHG